MPRFLNRRMSPTSSASTGRDMSVYPRSILDVNKALRQAGYGEYTLVRGKGYFYFDGPGTEMWYTTSVPVYHVYHLDLDQWVQRFKELGEDYLQENTESVLRRFSETTSMGMMASVPSLSLGMSVPVTMYLTSPDKDDEHVHECLLDEQGDGTTSVAGGWQHRHTVRGHKVLDYAADGTGASRSSHPGKLNKRRSR